MSNRTAPLLIFSVLVACTNEEDLGDRDGKSRGDAGSDTTQGKDGLLDPGSCSFSVTGSTVDSVATVARGITEHQGSSVLLFECAPDITQLAKRLRMTVNGYHGVGSYSLDNTNANGRVQFDASGGDEITNWPGASSAACAIQVTSGSSGWAAGTFSCTDLTDSAGQRSNIENGIFEFHGVPWNVALIP